MLLGELKPGQMAYIKDAGLDGGLYFRMTSEGICEALSSWGEFYLLTSALWYELEIDRYCGSPADDRGHHSANPTGVGQ